MLRKKKPAFIIAFDATTQAMATDKLQKMVFPDD